MDSEKKMDKAMNLETDGRFCSGFWKGFFLQDFPGQRPTRYVMDLKFRFSQGRVESDGRDYVGPFVMHGRYDLETGRCDIVKQYLGGHEVLYWPRR